MTGVRRDALLVAPLVLAVVVVHLAFISAPLIPDEAGFYLVGRSLSLDGPHLYGRYWVDRPPLLIWLNALAALTGHVGSLRVLGALCAGLAVGLVGAASARLRGSAVVASVTAALLLCAPTLETLKATAALFAAPFSALAVLAVLAAVLPPARAGAQPPASEARRVVLALVAGAASTDAVMLKQNMLDGAVFATFLVALSVLRGEVPVRTGLRLGAGGLAGGVLVLGAVLAFAESTPVGWPGLWQATVSFRLDAAAVIFGSVKDSWFSPSATSGLVIRFQVLVALAVLSGIVAMYLVLAGRVLRARLRGSTPAWAAGLCLALDLVWIVTGGSYWPHYLIQPVVLLALSLSWSPGLPSRAVVVLAGLSTATTLVVAVQHDLLREPPDRNAAIGRWVARASEPGDTATVYFGHADIQLLTGLESPYAYLWSLPIRTRDPHLRELNAVLSGPLAPRFLVANNGTAAMFRRSPAVKQTVSQRYVALTPVCGRRVLWVLVDAAEAMPPVPACGGATRQPHWYVSAWVERLRRSLTADR